MSLSRTRVRAPHTDIEDISSKYDSNTSSGLGSETEQPDTKTGTAVKPADAPDPSTQSDASASTPNSHFICTFCWTPQYPPSKPKLVGSSRISCTTCWKEVLDLSICWVCGEQIVRGEEVVSLGWCFWHKGCFGCLICGRALRVPGEAVVDVERGDYHGDGKGNGYGKEKKKKKKKKERGVELESIPLCVDCGAEMDGQDEGDILERGLETVGRFDGGLSRSRLMRISEATEREREADGLSMRWVSALVCGESAHKETERDRECLKFGIGRRSPAMASGSDTQPLISDSVSWKSMDEDSRDVRQDVKEIYVSILNPLQEPVFRPSKTKPLPKWMTSLPSSKRRKTDAVCPPDPHSIAAPAEVIAQNILEFHSPSDSASDASPQSISTPIAEGVYPSLGSNSDWTTNASTDIQEVLAPKPPVAQIESLDRRLAPRSPRVMGKTSMDLILPPGPLTEQLESPSQTPLPGLPILDYNNMAIKASLSSTKRKPPFVRTGILGRSIETDPFTRASSTDNSGYFNPMERPREEAFFRGRSRLGDGELVRPEMLREKDITGFPFLQSVTPAKESFRGTPSGSQVIEKGAEEFV